MSKKTKKIGELDKKLCIDNGIPQFANMDIVQSFGLIKHVLKHANQFCSVDSFNTTLSNISDIISKPYFVYYDSIRHSFRYYKKVKEYVCVVVNITSTEAFVSTFYPIKKSSIDKLKNKTQQ